MTRTHATTAMFVLRLGCILWLLPGSLLCENTPSFGCIRNSSFLVVGRPFSSCNPGSTLIHTDLCSILPCIGRHDHACSRHVVGRYIYLRALVGSGHPSRISLLLILDRGAVLCAAVVPLVD